MNFDSLNPGSLSLAAIATGLVVALWSKIKAISWRIANLFVCQTVVEYPGATVVSRWLWRNGKRSRFGEKRYNTLDTVIKAFDRRMTVGLEEIGRDMFVMWFGWKPLWVGITTRNEGQHGYLQMTLWYVRGMFDMDRIMLSAVEDFNKLRHGRDGSDTDYTYEEPEPRYRATRCLGTLGYKTLNGQGVSFSGSDPTINKAPGGDSKRRDVRYIGYSEDEIGQASPVDPMFALAFPKNVDGVLDDIDYWLKSEKRFKSRGIPWRMSLAFVGPPGTGKSTLAKAIAQRHDLPLMAFDLPTFLDRDLVTQWRECMAQAPCVVLIEDIDNVFHGRENITDSEEKLNFGCLLQCLSGVEGADGILTIITSNKPETFDEALGVVSEDGMSSRPGRIDRIVTLGHPDEDCRRRIAKRILDEFPETIEGAVISGVDDSGAQFTQRCCDIAKDMYRKRQLEALTPATSVSP